MRYLYYIFLFSLNIISQEAVQGTLLHDDLEREYILYIPNSYDGQEPFPLVLNLHGYTSNGGEQMIYSNLFEVADTANFLIVHPTGTLNTINEEFWNSGEIFEVDDIGFLSELIDYLVLNYNIDTNRVYSTGFSNGGFMSYTLACELSEKIAAIASVNGSMITNQQNLCNPNRSVPVMQIHGTLDLTVPYFGNTDIEPIEEVISHWISFNNCDSNPIYSLVPDIITTDLCYAEHYKYLNGNNGSSVEFYKVIYGGHTWPGAYVPLFGNNTNQDFKASEKIWEFFSKYDINGLVDQSNNTDVQEITKKNILLNTYNLLGIKNPKHGFCFEIYDDGAVIKKYKL
tara:strand:+ start:3089 stop:4114 length:1026 start_codon:yes stop_codon:yes gene_type:complete